MKLGSVPFYDHTQFYISILQSLFKNLGNCTISPCKGNAKCHSSSSRSTVFCQCNETLEGRYCEIGVYNTLAFSEMSILHQS